ncbi:hypothetical protein [Rathayibacter sp. AY2B5]|uniref:hypothetical protein n=1 Tax=Rathayibacter sp. AY2B5 TaxID=2080570 RepID=UPI000CE75CF1|nr:hypothetical protein [Rathayibacter sp. AY2B5]PPG42852.1 hypothetical protein C5C30_04915 [Rathayibacter sp. AY2B5]
MADDPAEQPINQIDEVELRDIGRNLVELAERLRRAGALIETRQIAPLGPLYHDASGREMTDEEVTAENTSTRVAFRDALNAMRDFRRGYNRWERLTAEYALTRMNYSQRDAASELGVAASTINRWAQHPLPIEDYS